jgi:hypothetical protein
MMLLTAKLEKKNYLTNLFSKHKLQNKLVELKKMQH